MANETENMSRDAQSALGFKQLMAAAEDAAEWLCEAAKGTDPRERGDALRAAINAYRARRGA